MFPDGEQVNVSPSYQGAYMDSGEKAEDIITYDSGSKFSNLIHGRISNDVWAIMDDLMNALVAVNPRLYDFVIRKLK